MLWAHCVVWGKISVVIVMWCDFFSLLTLFRFILYFDDHEHDCSCWLLHNRWCNPIIWNAMQLSTGPEWIHTSLFFCFDSLSYIYFLRVSTLPLIDRSCHARIKIELFVFQIILTITIGANSVVFYFLNFSTKSATFSCFLSIWFFIMTFFGCLNIWGCLLFLQITCGNSTYTEIYI